MDECKKQNTKCDIKRIGGYLHRVIHIADNTGKVVQTVISPFMVELKPRDILQLNCRRVRPSMMCWKRLG